LLGIFYLSIAVIGWNIGVFRIQWTGANSYHFTQVCAIQMLFGAFVVSIISYIHGDFSNVQISNLPWKAWSVFIYLALIGSTLGFSLFGYLSKACDATLVATYTYVNPVIALILGNLILSEPLSSGLLLSSFLILFAVVLITTEKQKPNKR
jgi:drug/metabolite transporter (DMT)-like permease